MQEKHSELGAAQTQPDAAHNPAEDEPEEDGPEEVGLEENGEVVLSVRDFLRTSRREALHARTQNNLAAAQATLKDAGNVAGWSQALIARLRRRGRQADAARQDETSRLNDEPANGMDAAAKEPVHKEPVHAETIRLASGKTALLVSVTGDLDMITSPQLFSLLSRLDAEIEAAGSRVRHRKMQQPVVVDLRGTALLDSAGLSVLIKGRLLFTRRRMRFLVLMKRGSQPDFVFYRHGLASIIPSIDSLDEA